MADFDKNNETFFWDQVSTMTPKESEETIKDLFSSAFRFAESYISELFWVDQNFLYLNLVCNTPQHQIAQMFGVSQIGVSKRVRSSVKKIKWVILKPEKNVEKLMDNLSFFLSHNHLEAAVLYYQYGTYSIVSKLIAIEDFNVRNSVTKSIQLMSQISKMKSPDEMYPLIKKSSSTTLEFHQKINKFKEKDFDSYLVKINQYLQYFEGIQKHFSYANYAWKVYDRRRSW